MELNYDWRNFQAMFYPGRRAPLAPGEEIRTPIYLVTQGELIVCAFSEYEDLSAWAGCRYQDVAVELPQREFVLLEREKVDQVLQASLGLPHFHDQVEYLREQASAQRVAETAAQKPRKFKAPKPFVLKPGTKEVAPRHFLLDAIQGWWGRVLPSAYGILIRLQEPGKNAPCRDMLLIVRRGRLDGFHVPDLTSLGKERRQELGAVARYLSEKHLVPVQGLSVSVAEWNEWAQAPHPWKKVAAAVRADRAQLVPFRWGITSLLATRAYFGI